MPIRFPLDALLRQGAVFLHHRFPFPVQSKAKFLVYLSSLLHPEPLLVVLTTTDPGRKIPDLPAGRQEDILAIPPGELDFFKSDDHTMIDLNNHRSLDKERFQLDYDQGVIEYMGVLSPDHLEALFIKARESRILQPDIKKRILGMD